MESHIGDTMERKLSPEEVIERDMIVFGGPTDWGKKQLLHFKDLDIARLAELVEKDLIDLDDQQNEAPTLGEFLEFMKEHPRFTAHGYVITPMRPDARLTIEGITLNKKPTKSETFDFIHLCRLADEFECCAERLSCWYD